MQSFGGNAKECAGLRLSHLSLPRARREYEADVTNVTNAIELDLLPVVNLFKFFNDSVDSRKSSELIASRALLRSVAVVRFRIWLATALALGAIVTGLVRAQVNEEQKSRRDESESNKISASSPKPKKSPTPKAKTATSKSAKRHRASDASVTPKKSPSPSAERKTSKESPGDEEAPKPAKTPAARPEPRSASSEMSPPPLRAVAVPTPTSAPQPKTPRAAPAGERAQVVIEKSGVEEDEGFEPPPSPPPRRFGFWPWSRQSTSYRYLTRSVIEAIRRAPVKRRRWQFIVVHNSGTRQGNARVFDYYHRHVRRMQNGLAYHFVIGNGTSTGNGQIEVGDRWRRQINGGHVHSDYLN